MQSVTSPAVRWHFTISKGSNEVPHSSFPSKLDKQLFLHAQISSFIHFTDLVSPEKVPTYFKVNALNASQRTMRDATPSNDLAASDFTDDVYVYLFRC